MPWLSLLFHNRNKKHRTKLCCCWIVLFYLMTKLNISDTLINSSVFCCLLILSSSWLYFGFFLLCRSSSNSLGRRSYRFSGAPLVGGSLRVHSTHSPNSYAAEQESLLSHPSHSNYPLPPHHPPPASLLLSRHLAARRDRRALSLEFPELLLAGGQPPGQLLVHLESGRRNGSGTGGSITGGSGMSVLGVDHRDCNGKTPGPRTQLMAEIFPQVNARKDRADLDEETDYVSQ